MSRSFKHCSLIPRVAQKMLTMRRATSYDVVGRRTTWCDVVRVGTTSCDDFGGSRRHFGTVGDPGPSYEPCAALGNVSVYLVNFKSVHFVSWTANAVGVSTLASAFASISVTPWLRFAQKTFAHQAFKTPPYSCWQPRGRHAADVWKTPLKLWQTWKTCDKGKSIYINISLF